MPDGATWAPGPDPIAEAWSRSRVARIVRGIRRLRGPFPEFAYWSGILAAFYFWITVSIDVYINRSWWVFGGSSFSALGDPGPNCSSAAAGLNWIYNDVVIFPTAILLMLFCAGMVQVARNKTQSTAYSFFLVAAGFLFLVGVFHGETSSVPTCAPHYVVNTPYPPEYHDFVSDAFFFMADIAFLVLALGLLIERRFELSYLFLTLAVLTPLLVDGLDHTVTAAVIGVGVAIFLLFDLLPVIWYLRRAVARTFVLGYQFVLPALLLPLLAADALHSTGLSVAENEAAAIIAIDLAAILMYWARRPRASA